MRTVRVKLRRNFIDVSRDQWKVGLPALAAFHVPFLQSVVNHARAGVARKRLRHPCQFPRQEQIVRIQ